MNINGRVVIGEQVDLETRCAHFHKDIDRIAIKFYCCNQYFPCYQCHSQHGCGQLRRWPQTHFNEKAILCGTCGFELSINQYLGCASECPNCQSSFNPGCNAHTHLYFEVDRHT
ncbi:CHY zinc finger protein [Sporosarcina aquimarina]|uniref:CHY zinc finger protein n=1 Tax=Sporosarcina aquimarina TaxID=114975 RepID=A0ABU4FZF2_9BACL|nr:CHY zinc finger protein [Sporosarcina aquimarina]MDW0109448.1 CHY zinc finger protein [Sporosarcina aquimarina]